MQLASRYIDLIEEGEKAVVLGQENIARRRETDLDVDSVTTSLAELQRDIDAQRRELDARLRRLAETFGVEVP